MGDNNVNRHWNTANPLYYDLLKRYAYKNRYNQTEAEKNLWYHLSGNHLGFHFRRQHIIGCYIADFICVKRNLIIEIDGGYHLYFIDLDKIFNRIAKPASCKR